MTPAHNHGQDNGNLLIGCTCDEPWSGFALAAVIPSASPLPGPDLRPASYRRGDGVTIVDYGSSRPPLPWYERFRPIYEAVLAMCARCDGAQEEDSRGWNKDDAYPMHMLADTPIHKWAMQDFAESWHRLYKYRRTQLPFYGIDYDKLPRPVARTGGAFSASSLH